MSKPDQITDPDNPVDGRTLVAREKQQKTRQKILDAALDNFAKHGYRGTTIGQILKDADIGRATFYSHFTGKAEVFIELLDDFLVEVDKVVWPIRHAKEGVEGDELEQVIANIYRIIDIIEKRKGVSNVLMREAYTADPECQYRIQVFFDRLVDITVYSLRKGLEAKLIDIVPGTEQQVAKIIIGSFKEVIFVPLASGLINADETRELATTLVAYHSRSLSLLS